VSNVICKDWPLEPNSLKQALKASGWEVGHLDYHKLELNCLFLENEKLFEINYFEIDWIEFFN
jgi:hypothetical protein